MKPAGETSKNMKEKLATHGSLIAAIGHVPHVMAALCQGTRRRPVPHAGAPFAASEHHGLSSAALGVL